MPPGLVATYAVSGSTRSIGFPQGRLLVSTNGILIRGLTRSPIQGIVSTRRLHDLLSMQEAIPTRDLQQFGYLANSLCSVLRSADCSPTGAEPCRYSDQRLTSPRGAGSRSMREPLPLYRSTTPWLKPRKHAADTPNAKCDAPISFIICLFTRFDLRRRSLDPNRSTRSVDRLAARTN
jgi:hypothetical protein